LNPAQIFVALTSWPSFLWSTLFPGSAGGGVVQVGVTHPLNLLYTTTDHQWMPACPNIESDVQEDSLMTSNSIGSQLTTGPLNNAHGRGARGFSAVEGKGGDVDRMEDRIL